MVIRQGDIFWVDLGDPVGSRPGYRHPHVIIQNDIVNASGIQTVIMCTLTSNLKRAASPGNVLLKAREARLPKRSVVNVSQVFTVDKRQLVEKIGSLSTQRVREILEGLNRLLVPLSLP